MISAEGIRFDPRRFDGLLNMELPTTGTHLQQFVCALQWIRLAIPLFTELVAPLNEFIERNYDRAGKRTRLAVSLFKNTTFGWDPSENADCEAYKTALVYQVPLSHRDDKKTVVRLHRCLRFSLVRNSDTSSFVGPGPTAQGPA